MRKIIPFILLAEILSYISFANIGLSPWIFGIVSTLVIMATVYKLKYGIILLFGELIIGSLGKMFVLEINGFDVTIRMLIWLVVMLVWSAHALKDKKSKFIQSQFFKPYIILGIIVVWATIWGIVNGNGLGIVFGDVNNYLYFTLIFPVYDVLFKKKESLNQIVLVIVSAITWLAIKTIALYYIFSHEFFWLQDRLYDWSRFTRLAEITNIDPNILTSRIFMQSQIWILFILFVLLGVLYGKLKFKNNNNIVSNVTVIIISISAIIMSFSRSFWLAGIVSLIFMIAILVLNKEKTKQILSFSSISIGLIVVGIALATLVSAIPIAKSDISGNLLKDRAAKFSGEAAVSSRYAQIKPLLSSIKNHPVLGSGFGTSVTYASLDPRVLNNNANGLYTTTSFELGWLEIWLKLGLLGLGFYLYLLWVILKSGWKLVQDRDYIILGAIIGLISVALTHGISPYLNHPLGIGVVILITSIIGSKLSLSKKFQVSNYE